MRQACDAASLHPRAGIQCGMPSLARSSLAAAIRPPLFVVGATSSSLIIDLLLMMLVDTSSTSVHQGGRCQRCIHSVRRRPLRSVASPSTQHGKVRRSKRGRRWGITQGIIDSTPTPTINNIPRVIMISNEIFTGVGPSIPWPNGGQGTAASRAESVLLAGRGNGSWYSFSGKGCMLPTTSTNNSAAFVIACNAFDTVSISHGAIFSFDCLLAAAQVVSRGFAARPLASPRQAAHLTRTSLLHVVTRAVRHGRIATPLADSTVVVTNFDASAAISLLNVGGTGPPPLHNQIAARFLVRFASGGLPANVVTSSSAVPRPSVAEPAAFGILHDARGDSSPLDSLALVFTSAEDTVVRTL